MWADKRCSHTFPESRPERFPQPKYRIPESGAIPRSTVLRPAVSEFNSVDPAPANPERDVEALHALLLDTHRPMFERFRAIFSLRSVNTDAAVLVLGDVMVRDRSALLRHECAYVLGQMQRAASVPHLTSALRHDPSPMVRHEAAEALGAIGTEEVFPILRQATAEDPALEVRESCQVALDHAAYLRNPNEL